MLTSIVVILNWLVLCFLIYCSFGYILLLVASIRDIFRRYQEINVGDVLALMKSQTLIPVTVLIAAYNEEENITESIESVFRSDYEQTNVIVINDGSTDGTLKKLIERYNLHPTNYVIPPLIKNTAPVKAYYVSDTHPRLTVIDKVHRCKSDSLNIGINACRTPLFITVDADSLLDPSAISEMVFYMMIRSHAVAVGGGVYVLNGCEYKNGRIIKEALPKTYVAGVQACEYLRSFLFNRAGWNPLYGALSYSGTATLFEHKAVIDVGGFDLQNPANDFEVIVNLHAHKRDDDIPYEIGFTPAALAWTDVPSTLKQFWHQRTNWQIGKLRSLLLHKYMLFNPRYGIVGLFTYPFYLFCETLGAVVEFSAYVLVLLSWYLGIFDGYVVGLFFLVCLGFITLLTLCTVLMNDISYNKYGGLKDMPRILFYVLTEPFGFRQISVLCRVIATVKYFFMKRDVDDMAHSSA